MKNLLALVCVLGCLCGGVVSMYSAVSVGSGGLESLSKSLLSMGKVMKTYYKNLNSARKKIMPVISNYQLYVNTTYKALNTSYGAGHPDVQNVVSNLEWFTEQFNYQDKMTSSYIGYDLYHLNMQVQQGVDQIMQSYNMLANSFAYQQNGDSCSAQFAGVSSSIPDQLKKYGQCLQMEVDEVPTLVAPLKAFFTMAMDDLKSLNKQLALCAPTSTSCINEYINDIYNEFYTGNSELNLAQNLIFNYQQNARQRNQECSELVSFNIQDHIQNLQMAFGQCMYPQTSMG